jgi:benzoate membrane transport protein
MALPWLVLPLVIAFFVLRVIYPLYAVPVIVVFGITLAALAGVFAQSSASFAVTPLAFAMPAFESAAILSLGIPLFLVTMASQNMPGFAVLRAAGYEPPVSLSLGVTGLASVLLAPFGSHAINSALTLIPTRQNAGSSRGLISCSIRRWD